MTTEITFRKNGEVYTLEPVKRKRISVTMAEVFEGYRPPMKYSPGKNAYWRFHKIGVHNVTGETIAYYDFSYTEIGRNDREVVATHMYAYRGGKMVCIKEFPPRFRSFL